MQVNAGSIEFNAGSIECNAPSIKYLKIQVNAGSIEFNAPSIEYNAPSIISMLSALFHGLCIAVVRRKWKVRIWGTGCLKVNISFNF